MLLVTRPLPDALTTARQLEAKGFSVLVEPMMTIRPLIQNHDVFTDYHYQALIITSANALRVLNTVLPYPLYAVGAHTAEVAQELGFSDIHIGEGTAFSLVESIVKECKPQDGTLLYLSGKVTSQDMQSLLQPHGFLVKVVEVYDAIPVATLSEEACTALRQGAITGILFYSARTAQLFNNLITTTGHKRDMAGITAYALSDNVAAALAGLPFDRILTAKCPDTHSLLELLGQGE